MYSNLSQISCKIINTHELDSLCTAKELVKIQLHKYINKVRIIKKIKNAI